MTSRRDSSPERNALYTTVKNDHPETWDNEPCNCESGGTKWERLAWRPNKKGGKK